MVIPILRPNATRRHNGLQIGIASRAFGSCTRTPPLACTCAPSSLRTTRMLGVNLFSISSCHTSVRSYYGAQAGGAKTLGKFGRKKLHFFLAMPPQKCCDAHRFRSTATKTDSDRTRVLSKNTEWEGTPIAEKTKLRETQKVNGKTKGPKQ